MPIDEIGWKQTWQVSKFEPLEISVHYTIAADMKTCLTGRKMYLDVVEKKKAAMTKSGGGNEQRR